MSASPASSGGDLNSRTVSGLLAYCEWLGSKGYATAAQINPWRTAIQKVFETVEGEGWENLDLTTIDLEEYLGRFQTLAGANYKVDSITAYKRRIQRAVAAHEHYLDTGRPPSFRQASRASKPKDDDAGGSVVNLREQQPAGKPSEPKRDDLMEFPFPLKDGVVAKLFLPARITHDDVSRLTRFLQALQQEEQKQIPSRTGEE